jgi:serine-type D-Ala-D-Ala carboxypeptidase/endopeptidase
MLKVATSLLAFGVAITGGFPSSNLRAQNSPDPLRSAMAKRIDEAMHGTAAVVGLLTPEGRSFASYGRVSIGGRESDADTIFEIGSITKVFTAFLFADMLERGEVALDDPVRKYLPTFVKVPSRRGREISLVDLATHTSGLRRNSVEVDPLKRDDSPYAGYAARDLYAFLERSRLERDPGSQWEYSNVGIALLGHALALRAGVSYEDLLRQRLFEPLAMTSTTITPDAGQRARRATGHNARLLPVPAWIGGVIAPAGDVTSQPQTC